MQEKMEKLKKERFVISPESLELIKKERAYLNDKKKEIPELAGLSFFGSRTVGQEKPDSDLDMMVFYDSSSCFEGEETKAEKIHNQTKKIILESQIDAAFRTDTISEEYQEHKGTFLYDISPDALAKNLNNFINLLKNQESGVRKPFGKESVPGEVWDIASLFFLGVGEGLFKARSEIFDMLEKIPDGEAVWGKVADYLSIIERDMKTKKREALPAYSNYPSTIAEAREFFIYQQYK